MVDDARIRILPLGAQWETLGSDRLRGIVPEGITAASDPSGPSSLDFTLKAEEGARRPDLAPFTPVELEVGGILVWSGFIWQRPTDANNYSVSCRGWQFHLDDDRLDRVWVHTRLSDYRDQRTFLTAPLTNFQVAGVVNTDGGMIQLGWPNGTVLTASSCVGVTLDLGPDSLGTRLVMTWESSNNDVGSTFFARASAFEASVGNPTGENDFFTFLMNSGASGTSSGSVSPARRYVHLFLFHATAGTLAADVTLRIKSVQVFRNTADESGNASILKADTVIKQALPFAPLLNQDTSLISAGTFSIPMYATGGYLAPRAVMEAVNTLENYRLKLGGADLRTLVYDAKPTAPIAEVGDWSGSQFTDATITGEPIFNRAITDGTGPDGSRLVSKRTQTGDMVTRRGFTRSVLTPISTAVTQAVADRIGDLYLAEHGTAPFSGTLTVSGDGARRILSGTSIPPYEFLRYSGEMIRLSNRVDPDTGNWGRDGRIAGATYRHNDRTVEIAIDNQPYRFDEILARYAALVGG